MSNNTPPDAPQLSPKFECPRCGTKTDLTRCPIIDCNMRTCPPDSPAATVAGEVRTEGSGKTSEQREELESAFMDRLEPPVAASQSETPRTDAMCENNGIAIPLAVVPADFARALERELAEMTRKMLSEAHKFVSEADRLEILKEQLTAANPSERLECVMRYLNYTRSDIDAMMTRAEIDDAMREEA